MELQRAVLLSSPLERASRAFRAGQKSSEKELQAPVALVNELCHRVDVQAEDEVKWDKVRANLKRVEERLVGIKRKLETAKQTSIGMLDAVEQRIAFLDSEKDTAEHLNLLIADHLARSGYFESADTVATLRGQECLMDSELYKEIGQVVEALRENCDVKPALEWCAQNKSVLKRSQSCLEFQLHKFRFLQMVQEGNVAKAVAYAKKHLTQFAAKHMREIQKAMVALAFVKRDDDDAGPTSRRPLRSCNESTKKRKIGLDDKVDALVLKDPREVIGEEERDALAALFKREAERSLSLESQSSFQVAMKAGLAALHTSICDESLKRGSNRAATEKEEETPMEATETDTNANQVNSVLKKVALRCPCCTRYLGRIAAFLP